VPKLTQLSNTPSYTAPVAEWDKFQARLEFACDCRITQYFFPWLSGAWQGRETVIVSVLPNFGILPVFEIHSRSYAGVPSGVVHGAPAQSSARTATSKPSR
jgi:hypothetical protein